MYAVSKFVVTFLPICQTFDPKLGVKSQRLVILSKVNTANRTSRNRDKFFLQSEKG